MTASVVTLAFFGIASAISIYCAGVFLVVTAKAICNEKETK